MKTKDPITTEVIRHSLETIAEEMRTALYRTAFTVVVKDMLDYSCALFDRHGRLIATAIDIPTLIASMGSGLRAVIDKWEGRIDAGDVFLTNDPYNGGTHTPDVHIFIPIFDGKGERVGFAGNIAHHADWGGRVPGTVSAANQSVYEEGVVYPAVKLEQRGERNEAVYDTIVANLRQPDLNMGDLRAQLAAARTGERRFARLVERYGTEVVLGAIDDLIGHAGERTKQEVAALPDGVYEAEGFLDDDGFNRGEPVRIHARIVIDGDSIVFDFSGCAEQTPGGMNCPLATTRSDVHYALKCIISDDIPFNEGSMEAVEIIAPPGSIVNPGRPGATGDRHLTSQRVCDVTTRALSQAAPEKGSAGWFSGWPFIICESTSPKTGQSVVLLANIGGGAGAASSHDGADGVDIHGANCAIIPAETVEVNYPLRVERYELIRDSGGAGRQRGGLGIRADYRILSEQPIFFQSEVEQSKQDFAPAPIDGGMPGSVSGVLLLGEDGEERPQDPKSVFEARAGDVVSMRAGGGGGSGDPRQRDPELVEADLRTGRISEQVARELYRVEVAADGGVARTE
ncbi:MAG: hydantoinase B/oxoprolinase family protein [Solirubrobacterales bacterium]